MCQAVPYQVLRVTEGRAEVLYEGKPTWVAVHGIPDLQPGEYVVVYADQVLERVPEEEALHILRLLDELQMMYAEMLE